MAVKTKVTIPVKGLMAPPPPPRLGLLNLKAGFLFFPHFTVDFSFTHIISYLREACAFGQRKTVDRFKLFTVGVIKSLVDFGHGKTVVDYHIDMMVANQDGLMAGANGG